MSEALAAAHVSTISTIESNQGFTVNINGTNYRNVIRFAGEEVR